MEKYASLAVYDRYGNLIGYRSTTTGEMIEWTAAAFPEFQRQFALSSQAKEHDRKQHELDQMKVYAENPDFLEITP